MKDCQHLSEKGARCGRPAVALWRHPVLGDWWLCRRDDDRAVLAALPEWLRIAELPASFADPLTLAEVAA